MAIPSLDHLVLDVGERLDDAAAAYRRLGFQLTERGHHTLGSSNHLAMFRTNYLELLSPGASGAPIRAELAGFVEGLNGLVLATDDADAQYRDLVARGVTVREPQSFSRPVTTSDGVTRDARFRTTHLAREEVPFGRLYFCQHDTRDLVWRPEWQEHPNGAEEIVGIAVSAGDPVRTAALFTRLFDAEPVRSGAWLRLSAGPVAIDIADHATVARDLGGAAPAASGRDVFLAGIRLKTRAMSEAKEAIDPAALAGRTDGRLIVQATAAGNVALEFLE